MQNYWRFEFSSFFENHKAFILSEKYKPQEISFKMIKLCFYIKSTN